MGQYYKIVNLGKPEMLVPHTFGDGAKLMGFGGSGHGVLSALASLLVWDPTYKGSWVGSPVVVTGDYADEGKFVPRTHRALNLYAYCSGNTQAELDTEWGEKDTEEARAEVLARGVWPAHAELTPVDVQQRLDGLASTVAVRTGFAYKSKSDTAVAKFVEKLPEIFEQPEDFFDAFDAGIAEDMAKSLDEVLTTLRVRSIPSKFAWSKIEAARVTHDKAGQRVTALTMTGKERDQQRAYSKTLKFPATKAEALQFLGCNT